MGLRVAGFDAKRLFGRKDKIVGRTKKITLGDYDEIHDEQVILQNIVHILSTPRGKRVKDCSFGCDLYKYIFEPLDDVTAEQIRSEIISAIEEQEERARVAAVYINEFTDAKGFEVEVHIVLPSGRKEKVSVPLTEEMFNILEPTKSEV